MKQSTSIQNVSEQLDTDDIWEKSFLHTTDRSYQVTTILITKYSVKNLNH